MTGLGCGLPLQQSGDFVCVDLGVGHVSTGEAGDVEAFEVAADLAIPATADAGLEKHRVLAQSTLRCNYLSHLVTYTFCEILTTLTQYAQQNVIGLLTVG